MWKIGDVELANPVIAAPMAGISSPAFRTICRQFGAALCVSEMISDKALHYHNAKTFEMCAVDPHEHPVSLQLFGGDPETMAEAAHYLCAHTDCDIIDINMGCPVSKVLKAHGGSYLLGEPELAVEVVKAVVAASDRPVTVKMRAGIDEQHIVCADLARRFEEAGVQAIAVHGRTRSQMYEGHVHPEYIRMVKEAVKIPVIANGDMKSVADVQAMIAATGCDAVMIGRGFLGRPYFIRELTAWFAGETCVPPTEDERLDMCMDHARRLCAEMGERQGIRNMRGIGAWYLSGMPYSTPVKAKMSALASLQDLQDLLEGYRRQLSEYRQAV
jgi:nifR3 family TIM-barrel protein